ncbi:glutathione S-transferase [Neoconidiobolus thromboides FSU 785]|nr:glutathione S-transferase [Neoconidiobolus thromboides FSU 785]
MGAVGRLHSIPNYERANKILIAAKLSNVEIDYDPNFKFGVDNKTEEYIAKFPLGQAPAFESKDGLLLTESDAITFYIASQKENNPLLGSNKNDYAKILQYSYYGATQITPPALQLYMPLFGFAEYDKKVEETAYTRIDKALSYLDNEIKGKEYLVGNHITLADVFMFCVMDGLYRMFYTKEHRDQYPNFSSYFERISQIPEVKEVVGEFKYAQERKKYTPKA